MDVEQDRIGVDAGSAGNLPDGFEWAIVEIFGHRKHAGRVVEVERFGAKMLRIDVPAVDYRSAVEGQPAQPSITSWTTHWYGGASIFSLTLTDEASVIRINRPYVPAQRYIAPPLDLDDDDFSESPGGAEPSDP